MTLVSRKTSPLAQEILYHEFIPAYGEAWYEMHNRPSAKWDWRLVSFLRTVAEKPNLAIFVKRIYVDFGLLDHIPVPEAEKVLKEAAQARNLPEIAGRFQCTWHPGLYELVPGLPSPYHYGSELLGMLLACLPRLKTLTLSPPKITRSFRPTAFSAASVIETLDIDTGSQSMRVFMAIILQLASSTRNLYFNNCQAFTDLTTPNVVDRPFPNLRNLCVIKSWLPEEYLSSFLSNCSVLESFFYDSGVSSIRATRHNLPSELTSAEAEFPLELQHGAVTHFVRNKPTLQTLHLHHPPQWVILPKHLEALDSLLDSLKDFPSFVTCASARG
jgi:hypothetical protein